MVIDRAQITKQELTGWPMATAAGLSAKARARFQQREMAIRLLAQGETLAEITRQTGLVRPQLHRLVERALAVHSDGRLVGFRALLPFVRIKVLQRRAPVASPPHGRGGQSGAMTQLLARYPELMTALKREIARYPLLFSSVSNGKLHVNGLHAIHRAFLDHCRRLGLRVSDYPLERDQKGIRALSQMIKRLGMSSFSQAAKASGADRTKGQWRDDAFAPLVAVTRPLQAVEFDGHRLDLRLSITYVDSFGFEQTIELNRIWILAIADIFTRAILGYCLVLAPEYHRYDVIRTIQKALEPHAPMSFSIPGLGYGQFGGFPSQQFPELAYAVWEEFRLDNAKANLSGDTIQVLCQDLGCVSHAGPPADPDQRPVIERFFLKLTELMSHRLPASTESNPENLRRLHNAMDTKPLAMPLVHLEELVEAVLASINGSPHDALGGRSPLQAMEYFVRGKALPLRHLPEPMRRDLCLLQQAHIGRIAGSVARGVRPYISFYGVRYSSRVLSECTDLIGQQVQIYFNPDDIRALRVFSLDGGEIGVIGAARPWDRSPQSLRMRQQITKLMRDAKLRFTGDMDPVQAYRDYIEILAPKRRKAANELEIARRAERIKPPIMTVPPGPNYASAGQPDSNALVEPSEHNEQSKPVTFRRLRIPPGFNR